MCRRGKCAACPEKDKLIDTLAEQIEWLRAQLGSPTLRAINPSTQPEVGVMDFPHWTNNVHMSEEEEDVAAMVKAGRITEEQIPDVLEALGFANSEIDFAH